MEYQIEKSDGGWRRLSCFFSADEVLTVWKSAAAPFASSFRMAGFRPGKAPLEVLEKQFFQQISDTATDMLVSRATDQALASEKLMPATAYTYEGENARRGQSFAFSVTFGVLEPKDLPDLEELHVPVEEAQADPVQEELFLREILSREGRKIVVTEGYPQDGDLVEAEVTGRMDGRTVPGMNTGVCRIRLMPPRPGEKVPDLDPVVRGLQVGETGTGSTLCPDNYPDPSMRGKEIELVVTLRSMEREELPPLTDELARKLGFHDEQALRRSAHVRALEMDRLHRFSEGRRMLRDALEKYEGFEAPEALVQAFRRELMLRSRRYLQNQFESSDRLKEALDVMKQEAAEAAAGKARARALLLAWAESRGLSVDESEFGRVLAGRAARRNMDAASYRLSLARSGELYELRAAMLEDRALSELMKTAYRP